MSFILLFLLFSFYYFVSKKYMHRKIEYKNVLKDAVSFFLFHSFLSFLMTKSFFYPFSFPSIIYIFIHTFLYFFGKEVWKNRKKVHNKIEGFYLLIFVICLSISYLTEFTIFNYKHYSTFLNTPKMVDLEYHGLKKIKKNEYLITENKNVYIEGKNMNIPLNSAYICIGAKHSRIPITIKTYVKDEANALYYLLGEKETLFDIRASHYFKYHIAGKAKDIKLVLNDDLKGNLVYFEPVIFNPVVPFSLNKYRILSLSIFLFLIYLIRPHSPLYDYKTVQKFKYKSGILIVLFVFFFLFTLFFTNVNEGFDYTDTDVNSQYYELTESLLKGKFYLQKKPSEKLKALKNPYDSFYRGKYLKRGKDFYWDTAYYKGKYYVYFGITPVLTLFLPYYTITHTHLPIPVSILLFSYISILGIFYLLYQIIKKWFKNVSFINYLLLCFLFVSSSGLFYIIKRPTFYHIPIVCGFAFLFWGLGLWISATTAKKRRTMKLTFGSLCMALIAGARPQFLITYVFIPCIFYEDIWKKRNLFSKKSIKETILFLLPIFLFAFFLMYYNYARFSSIFDFGANYNLTTNDMTKRGFVLGRIPNGIFTYLFSPTIVSPVFPYLHASTFPSTYLGRVIDEPFMGGFLYNHILFIFTLFLWKWKSYFRKKETYFMALLSIFSIFIIIIFDIEGAGVLPRYICDFAFLFNIAFSLLLFSIENEEKKKEKRIKFQKTFLLLLIGSFLYEFFFLFTDISITLRHWNPSVFYKVSYFIQFWV